MVSENQNHRSPKGQKGDLMRKNPNIYRELPTSEVTKILSGVTKMAPGEFARVSVNFGVQQLIIRLSERDRAMTNLSSITFMFDDASGRTLKEFKGNTEPGFYRVVELTDAHPDGVSYNAFCSGSIILKQNPHDIDFEPARKMRLDRRIKCAPITADMLSQALKEAKGEIGKIRSDINKNKSSGKSNKSKPKPKPEPKQTPSE